VTVRWPAKISSVSQPCGDLSKDRYEKAAYEGDASAMNSLGALYYNGQGVAQDYAKVREWYEKSADKGDAIAMTSLGWLTNPKPRTAGLESQDA
jgi:TPR repeat protein